MIEAAGSRVSCWLLKLERERDGVVVEGDSALVISLIQLYTAHWEDLGGNAIRFQKTTRDQIP